ncbi:MAG TPA: hypothetical protein VEQ60_16245 [Longimicrobium sp.]|nr:hypothetical protein [Longimicrobium sp.]
MEYAVSVRGSGRVELAAYGLADAEHQVEKEIRALWPAAAAVDVTDVARMDEASRIVEEFRVGYRVRGVVSVTADTEAEARKAALRMMRDRFIGSRFERITWEVV